VKPTRVCAVSFKECWQNEAGEWFSSGGFPVQMAGIASLFDSMTLLVTRTDRPGPGGVALPPGAEIRLLRKPEGQDLARKLFVLRHLPEYLAAIAREARRADCIHVPPPGDIPLLGMLVALATGRRLIARYCGSWFPTAHTTWMNRVTRGLMRAFAGGRNVMLATGEGARPPARSVHWVFATGVRADELAGIRPDLSRGLSRPPRLAYVGRLSPEKGVQNLIGALAQLASDGFEPLPDVTLIGDGPQRPELERLLASLGLAGRVAFAGQVDRTVLSELLSRTDFCVQPSLTEGYSKAWLDAFAHGLPVLSSDAGAARSVVGSEGERGWLVPPGDVRRLTEVLREVISGTRDWPALRQRCRAFAQGRTLEAWAAAIGRICARQWGAVLIDGKLRFEESRGATAAAATGEAAL
jgi:glycosyltransferase involved in cell wall biosynthesis